ncbi:cytochrome c3 family protein [Inmirania thermothiophila]|uniref:Putative CXXCH cytochrome family protein n=1 Tax=Inmirania thermothiophila TaxID=1750597 RepID=A0A3N1Y257_9GAMM|nr:cytochrome c3 family protein [Inmirania thermothiophila]ROR32923.1 putative CXXCH cytochrome family protein [Inmirania thermothiophila]
MFSKMHKRVAILAGAAALAVAGGAFAGIAGSKHDFTASNGRSGTNAQFIPGGEICVFCHTPHGSDTGASAPLWNRVLDHGQTYTTYDSLGTSTLDGQVLTVGSVSLACLSCHDGTQAMDAVINKPGSGGYSASGDEISGTSITTMAGTPLPMLGTDLTNDHPVGVAYAGGGCEGKTGTGTCTSADFNDKDFNTAQFNTVNGRTVFWVDTSSGTTGAREKTDMVLYTRTFTAGDGPSVECASCHDPHNDGSSPVQFLRINNTGSAVCLACHNK